MQPTRAVSRKVRRVSQSAAAPSTSPDVQPLAEQPCMDGNTAVAEADSTVADAAEGKARAGPAKRQRQRSRKVYPDSDDRQGPLHTHVQALMIATLRCETLTTDGSCPQPGGLRL